MFEVPTSQEFEEEAGVAPSSPERVTYDELFGGEDSEDERLVDAALRDLEDVNELPEVGEDSVDV